jgi:hypothetical protein
VGAPAGDLAAEAERLILEAATRARDLSADELQRVLEHVARAGFYTATLTTAGGRLRGLVWRGRTLRGRDRLTPAEAHHLRHVVARRDWPAATSLADYLDSIRNIVLDPASGVLVSLLDGEWQLIVVRRSGTLRGPQGYEWVMVDYRVSVGAWMTAHQLGEGLASITDSPRRDNLRWLRLPS